MAQHFVMKTLQRKPGPFLLLPIAAQFENLQFAQSIIKIFRVEGAPNRFLPRWLLFEV